MRHQSMMISLADIIASHDKTQIQRELRLCAHAAIPNDEKQATREVLQLAEKFIMQHPSLPQGWRETLVCFSTLAEFFIQDKTITEHEEKAICCWYLLFAENKKFTKNFPHEKIVLLGKAYIPEPYQFIGFIIWLLEQHIDPRFILNSQLLHDYFSYHIGDLSVIEQTYALLKQCHAITKNFLTFAIKTPCLLNCFTNNPPVRHRFFFPVSLIPTPTEQNILFVKHYEDGIAYTTKNTREIAYIKSDEFTLGIADLSTATTLAEISRIAYERNHINRAHDQYESYNIMGQLFEHPYPFSNAQAIRDKPSPLPPEYTALLISLFGFDYVQVLLDDDSIESQNALLALLHSEQSGIILDPLPAFALSNALNYEKTYKLLQLISGRYVDFDRIAAIGRNDFSVTQEGQVIFPEAVALEKELMTLIKSAPFYIHLSGSACLPAEVITQAITQLLACANSKSIYHIPFLVSLSKQNIAPNLSEMIITFLANYLIEIGNDLPSEYDTVLETVHTQLWARFTTIIQQYNKNINDAIRLFLAQKVDFFVVERIESAQLSAINLIKRLMWDLFTVYPYPYSTYALRHEVLEQYFLSQRAANKTVDFSTILKCITDDRKIHIRILQESLSFSKNTDYLKQLIQYVVLQHNDFIADFFDKPYGHNSYALDTIARQEHVTFREWAFSVVPITETVMLRIIKYSMEHEDTRDAERFIISPQISPTVALKGLSYLLEHRIDTPIKQAKFEKYISILHPNGYSKALTTLAFTEAVKYLNAILIERLCRIEKQYFPQELIEAQAIALMHAEQWALVKMLCGLSNKIVNPEIIQKNNVLLLITVLQERIKQAKIPIFYMSDIRREAYTCYDHDNTLFHIAAQSGCYDTVVEVFSFFAKYLHPKTMHMFLCVHNTLGIAPHCDETLPEAARINAFLAENRTALEIQYHFPATDGGLWHHQEDRKRPRVCPNLFNTTLDSDDEPPRKPARHEF